jgi:hypothetical protein
MVRAPAERCRTSGVVRPARSLHVTQCVGFLAFTRGAEAVYMYCISGLRGQARGRRCTGADAGLGGPRRCALRVPARGAHTVDVLYIRTTRPGARSEVQTPASAGRAGARSGSPPAVLTQSTSLLRHAHTTAKHVPTCRRPCRVARLADRLAPAHTKPAHAGSLLPPHTDTFTHIDSSRKHGRHACMRCSRPSVACSREARLGVEAIHTCSPLADGSRSKWRNSRGSRAAAARRRLRDGAESPRPSGRRDAAPSPLGRQVDGRE